MGRGYKKKRDPGNEVAGMLVVSQLTYPKPTAPPVRFRPVLLTVREMFDKDKESFPGIQNYNSATTWTPIGSPGCLSEVTR